MWKLRRWMMLLLCTALILGIQLGSFSLAEEAEKPAPTVRVWLRRWQWESQGTLTLTGEYEAETASGARLRLPEGTKGTVSLQKGSLFLFFGEYSLAAGERLTMVRTDENAGLRGKGAEGVYQGDLTVTIQEGKLLPVLTLSVEEYLRGVVPYEMSDYYPLEALKAQAVCARTYALYRRDASRAWDVTDDTADQVFRGIREMTLQADQAVRETAGLVITENGKLIPCYYSASNGGQTELPRNVWPDRPASGTYGIVEDPYDVENPGSIVRKARINRDGRDLPEAFLSLIREAAVALPGWQALGWSPESLQVAEVLDVRLTEPKYDAPNRLMTKMELDVRLTGDRPTEQEKGERSAEASETKTVEMSPAPFGTGEAEMLLTSAEPEPTPTPSKMETADPEEELSIEDWETAWTCTLTLDIFPGVERALGLSINSAGNELMTVEAEEDGFEVLSRRFGHGVGMSQRGAQWMAAEYGKSFREILEFYYPGMTLQKAPTGALPIRTPDPALVQTPVPTPTPTPRPTLLPVSTSELPEGAWLASVEYIEEDSSLNLRDQPSVEGEILRRLYKHQRLIVLETCENPEWVRVKTDDLEGFVMRSFLEKVEVE